MYFGDLRLLKVPAVTISKTTSNSSNITIQKSKLVLKVFSKKV